MAETSNLYTAWKNLAVRAQSDPALRSKLVSDPAAALKANGVTVPAGISLKIVENTDKLVHLVLPVKGAPAELSEDELRQASGGRKYAQRDGDQGANRDPDRLVGGCDPNN